MTEVAGKASVTVLSKAPLRHPQVSVSTDGPTLQKLKPLLRVLAALLKVALILSPTAPRLYFLPLQLVCYPFVVGRARGQGLRHVAARRG